MKSLVTEAWDLHSNTAMVITWIVVASRTGARVFENRSPGRSLSKIEEFNFPEGRLRDHEIDAEPQGSYHDASISTRHGFSRHLAPTEIKAQSFARKLAEFVDRARARSEFDRLVLVAEPHFLGTIRSELAVETAMKIDRTIKKDLSGFHDREIAPHLDGEMNELWADVGRYGT